MNIDKYLPLTETTYYILLALMEPGHGYHVMQKVEELSDGRVRVAAGTMYGALDNLSKQKLIQAMPSEEPRRKLFVISEEGRSVLWSEVKRLKHMISIYNEYADEDMDNENE